VALTSRAPMWLRRQRGERHSIRVVPAGARTNSAQALLPGCGGDEPHPRPAAGPRWRLRIVRHSITANSVGRHRSSLRDLRWHGLAWWTSPRCDSPVYRPVWPSPTSIGHPGGASRIAGRDGPASFDGGSDAAAAISPDMADPRRRSPCEHRTRRAPHGGVPPMIGESDGDSSTCAACARPARSRVRGDPTCGPYWRPVRLTALRALGALGETNTGMLRCGMAAAGAGAGAVEPVGTPSARGARRRPTSGALVWWALPCGPAGRRGETLGHAPPRAVRPRYRVGCGCCIRAVLPLA